MAPAGRQGHPKATIGTPKGDRVDHNQLECWVVPKRYSEMMYREAENIFKRMYIDSLSALYSTVTTPGTCFIHYIYKGYQLKMLKKMKEIVSGTT